MMEVTSLKHAIAIRMSPENFARVERWRLKYARRTGFYPDETAHFMQINFGIDWRQRNALGRLRLTLDRLPPLRRRPAEA